MSRKHRNKTTACPNCGTGLQAGFEFCPHCGQENHDLRVPFKHFAYEFVENLTHFDTKLWSTLKMIFTKPGQLTKDFIEGKRARYVHPVRFYVFTSVIFFGLLTIYLDRGIAEEAPDGPGPGSGRTPARALSISASSAPSTGDGTHGADRPRQPIGRIMADSLVFAEGDSLGWFGRRAVRSLGRIDVDTVTGRQLLIHTAVRSVSIIMFILMPFTAILLLWIFYRQRYYWEHLIFSIHIHTIFFLYFSILLLFALVLPGEWPDWLLAPAMLVCLGYLVLSLRAVYCRPWISTLMRFLVMSIPYFIVFILLFVTGLFWGFISL
jgi:hypothetical protein